MGLQRKEGVRGQEGQQFDIRETVDEFRQEIVSYGYWKPGMEIYVSHVRRKQLPAFVFPDGYKRTRMPRHINHATEKMGDDTRKCYSGSSSSERCIKRKNYSEMVDVKPDKPEKRTCVSPQRLECVSPESCTSKLGGTPQMSMECIEVVRRDESTTEDVDSNCKINSSDGLLGSGAITEVGDMQINGTGFVGSTHDKLKSKALGVLNEVSLLNQRKNFPLGS
jgi:poly(A) polymerase